MARRPIISPFLFEVVERMCLMRPSDMRYVKFGALCTSPEVVAAGYDETQVWHALNLLVRQGKLETKAGTGVRSKRKERQYWPMQEPEICGRTTVRPAWLVVPIEISPDAARHLEISHLICGKVLR